MLTDGVILLHNNTHTSRVVKVQVENLEPSLCSPDLAPNLGSKHLAETRFSLYSGVKTTNENWLNVQRRRFYRAGLNKLLLRSDKCLNRFHGYVEK
ncbi:hypothetical protein AVEN_202046-1 [Araneus ventricosus]|uniref:Uncharacterized protein n=1 Tax=Araneus ventricosus TaxID=182803 RepID=A0A4Y2TSF8_ARAVE|nr:hypothetical protein AVEN_202046-1 [Araneus ventricosus]